MMRYTNQTQSIALSIAEQNCLYSKKETQLTAVSARQSVLRSKTDGEVSERLKERDWKSRSRPKGGSRVRIPASPFFAPHRREAVANGFRDNGWIVVQVSLVVAADAELYRRGNPGFPSIAPTRGARVGACLPFRRGSFNESQNAV